jgi:hypothetical protein
MKLNRILGIEIYIIHVGHFLLFIGALVILALSVPWWAMPIATPLMLFAAVFWAYEAWVVLPAANRLLRDQAPLPATTPRRPTDWTGTHDAASAREASTVATEEEG